jgi:hypothetical protein
VGLEVKTTIDHIAPDELRASQRPLVEQGKQLDTYRKH